MKVLHITSAGRQSGAGKGVLNLHNALRRLGVDSQILFFVDMPNEAESIYTISNNRNNKLKRLFITFLDNLFLKFYIKRKKQLFSPGIIGFNLLEHSLVQEASIIHFHWVNHGLVDLNSLDQLSKPIVWTMRDMWAFTGGCHYALDCDGYKNECIKCPILNTSATYLSSYCQKRKQHAYSKTIGIRWVAISSWLKTLAASSRILKSQNIDVINSGVDHREFIPIERQVAREKLLIKKNASVILLGAQNMSDPYKGLEFAIDAINLLERDVVVILFGSPLEINFKPHVELINVGYVSNSLDLSFLYSSANLFLCPSIAEAFGKTAVEAQMCGVPVVCFELTGPSEIIEHLKTGFTAKFKSVTSLLSGLDFVLNSSFDKEYIINRAKDKFSIDQNAIEYVKIYEELILKG